MSRFAFRRAEVVDESETVPAHTAFAPAPEPELAAPAAPAADPLLDMRLKLPAWLIGEIDLSKFDKLEDAEMRRQVRRLVGDFARAERLALNAAELDRL